MANMLAFVVTMVVVLGTVYEVSSFGVGPCACFKLSMTAIETCQRKSVFSVSLPKVTLNEDCTLVPEGCISYGAFNSSIISATMSRPFLSESTTYKVDACKVMNILPPEITSLLKSIKMDATCPVTVAGNKVCAQPPLTNYNIAVIPYYLDLLDMISKLGPMTTIIKSKHSTTLSSCLKLVGELKKDLACAALTTTTLPTLGTLPVSLVSTQLTTDLNPTTISADLSTISIANPFP